MANAVDIDADLTLEISGTVVSPETFQRSLRAFFGLLGEVTRSVCNGRPPVQWSVQVKAGSNLIGVAPVPGFTPEIIGRITTAINAGIIGLEREEIVPAHFSDKAIRHAQELAESAGTDSRDDTIVRVWARKEPLSVTHMTVAHAAALLSSPFEDHGSIDGRLQTVSQRGSMRFVVYETLGDRGVPCFIATELLADAIANFGKRVEVYGMVRYRKDGVPMSITVEEIVPFPAPDKIPDFRSVQGILRGAA